MGNQSSSENRSNRPSTVTAQQVSNPSYLTYIYANQLTFNYSKANVLQRLFSRGLHPDVSLLPYQMRRMKNDAPPKTQENRKTIRMKNIIYLNKKTFNLQHLSNNKYIITFEYSATLDVYCSLYFFTTEVTNKYNCTLHLNEKYKRPILEYMKEEKRDDDLCYTGTTYLLPKGYNLTFEQNSSDFMDLNAVNYKFFASNPVIGYYPIVVVFSLKKPKDSLLCDQDNMSDKHKNVRAQPMELMKRKDLEIVFKDNEKPIQYIDRSINYAKLILGADNLYSAEVVAQKTQVKNRAFESQDIYGLDRQIDPYSKEENLCVICMTMPKEMALVPCRHLCLCSGCSKQLLKRSNKCPVCRAYVSDTIVINKYEDNELL